MRLGLLGEGQPAVDEGFAVLLGVEQQVSSVLPGVSPGQSIPRFLFHIPFLARRVRAFSFLETPMARLSAADAGGSNVLAFLDMLAWSEGTSTIKASDDGYNVIVGGCLFHDYSQHPRVLVDLPRYRIKSTAAGRYQFLARTWDAIVRNYGFRGRFIPEAQDLAAIKLLGECGALPHIKAGRIDRAIAAAAPIWASLPGAGYGQREHRLASLLEIYAEERAAEQHQPDELIAMFTACGGSCA